MSSLYTQNKVRAVSSRIFFTVGLILLLPEVQWFFFSSSQELRHTAINGFQCILIPLFGSAALLHRGSRVKICFVIPLTLTGMWFACLMNVYNYPMAGLFILTVILFNIAVSTSRRIVLSLTTISAMLFLINLGFTLHEKLASQAFKYTFSKPLLCPNDDFGYDLTPDQRIIASKRYRDQTIYKDITYNIDPYGRRVCDDSPASAPFHALICGASFAFGEGLDASRILACQLQDRAQGLVKSYNLSVPGSGTGQTYIKLAKPEYLADVSQPAGICLYILFSDHTRRNTGHSLRTVVEDYRLPCYKLDDTGNLSGPLRTFQDPYLNDFFYWPTRLYYTSPIYRYYFYRFFKEPFSAEYNAEVTAQLISYAKYAYQTKFTGEFFVVFWPTEDSEFLKESTRILKEKLEKLSIKTLCPPLPDDYATEILHPRDPHPNSRANERVLNDIWSDIENYLQLLSEYHHPDLDD